MADDVITRNSTSFWHTINELYANYESTTLLKKHQRIVVDYYGRIDARGMLLFHGMGLGKTRVSIAISEMLLDRGMVDKIVVIEDAILHPNFEQNMQSYLGKELDNRYIFITRNSSKLMADVEQLSKHKRYLFIMDEAQLFFNGIVRGSKGAIFLYDYIMKSDARLLFLSGTPIINDPLEMAACFNMLNRGPRLFPESSEGFHAAFVNSDLQLINGEKFQNRICGLVSYHGSMYYGNESLEGFPHLNATTIVRVPMSPDQYASYQIARTAEQTEMFNHTQAPSRGDVRFNSGDSSFSTYRAKSRQLSNVWFIDKDRLAFDNMTMHSPKIADILEKIRLLPTQLTAIYSSFVKEYGLGTVAGALLAAGYEQYIAVKTSTSRRRNWNTVASDLFSGGAVAQPVRKFAIVSGDIDNDVRHQLLTTWSSVENAHGEIISVLLISSVAAQGIEIKNTRAVFILEPAWNMEIIGQVIGRVHRYMSHYALPIEEQTVTPYIYISVPPQGVPATEKTTDIHMLDRSIAIKRLTDQFNRAMAGAAIDCYVNNKFTHLTCRRCEPTGEKLFEEDFNTDMKFPSLCR